MKVTLISRLLAPYVAIAIFWCALSSAWLAILAYHVQILIWLQVSRPIKRGRLPWGVVFWATPSMLAGLLAYFLLPYITKTDLSAWLIHYGLSGTSFLIMIPYFGLVHPVLEELHWGSLREDTPLAHPVFAGFHLLVLGSLLTVPWLIASFAVLLVASINWYKMAHRGEGLAGPILAHVVADFSLILAAWWWI